MNYLPQKVSIPMNNQEKKMNQGLESLQGLTLAELIESRAKSLGGSTTMEPLRHLAPPPKNEIAKTVQNNEISKKYLEKSKNK